MGFQTILYLLASTVQTRAHGGWLTLHDVRYLVG